ncbi:MAG TPA: hypothetical protein VK889_10045 [Solirubrobacterales bacterium]|nr:hypothetical protein [Solirubrobacterales bacterium]
MRTSRACLAVVIALLGLGCFAPTAMAVPGKFWGIVPQATPTDQQFQRLARGGVESIRVPVGWASVQTARGATPDWSGPDSIIGAASKAGLDVLPFVTGAPGWAVPEVPVPGTGGVLKAPRGLPVSGAAAGAWKAILTAAVDRYGPGGTFWSANPGIPPRPVRAWQVWNEPNFKYFVARPNPVQYGKLVKLSYAAIKAADPGAQVILAGLYSRPIEAIRNYKPPRAYFATEFLERMYAKVPGFKRKFNGVALHPYTGSYAGLRPNIEDLRDVLQAHGDAGKGLWITELGWSSKPPTPGNSFAKGVAGQARELRKSFGLLKRNQARWKLKRLYWFSVDDQEGTCNFCDGSGLFANPFKPKKAWYEYVKFAGGRPN